jgi:dihydropteroate synthase
MKLDCGGRILDLSTPQVMGILNVTPDSFSDGGRFVAVDDALRQAVRMAEEGAAIIDVGGESTRPGAQPVSAQQEIDRVIPVIEAMRREINLPISIDTRKHAVMRAAVNAGAGMINDVDALRADGALQTAAALKVPVCLMHMRGEPQTMQQQPVYVDVVSEVKSFLAGRAAVAIEAGIGRDRIVLDPGFGFGKTLDHNLQLLRDLQQFATMGFPLLVGVSRKSMIGALLGGVPPHERVHGGVAIAVLALQAGARLIRTHDVRPTVDAVKIHCAVLASAASSSAS